MVVSRLLEQREREDVDMVGKPMTRQGCKMNMLLREKIVIAMVEQNGLPQHEIAARLGIHRRTLQDYLTPEVRRDISLRIVRGGPNLDDVDKAMMAQACNGNVAAARLVYMRMAQKGMVGPMPSLDELEAELLKLKQLEGTRDGASVDAVDAVAADAAGRAD